MINFEQFINEGVEPQIAKIANLTGTRAVAVEEFVSKHVLNITKLLKFLEKGSLKDRIDFAGALSGFSGNKKQKQFIDMFNESVTESSQIYFLVKNADTEKYEVRSGSKYDKTSKTGTYKFKNLKDAEEKADELNEGKKVTLKRRYTENYPAITAGKSARIRNKMLEAIADGKITQEEFDAILKEMSTDTKRWSKRNAKYFNVSEDGISLSKFGRRILNQIAVNEAESIINEKRENWIVYTGMVAKKFYSEHTSRKSAEKMVDQVLRVLNTVGMMPKSLWEKEKEEGYVIEDKAFLKEFDKAVAGKDRNVELAITESKGFKNTEDFEEFLKEIDKMPESSIRKIMGKDYIDTPGFYEDEKDDYEDVIDFMISNMGRKEFEKLQDWWENNVQESVVTEGKRVTLKRRYTENHPAITAGKNARIRNKMLEAIGNDGKITQEEFDNILKELSSNGKRWTRNNSKYFNVSEEGISLSKFGKRALQSITVNEEQPETNDKPLEMKVNEKTTENPEIWVPGAFDKELSKMPNSQITYDVVKKLAKKHKVFLDDAIKYVEYGWDLDLQENMKTNMKTQFIYESFNDFVNTLDESIVNEADDFAGWIAFYDGKKLEIKKDEAKDLYNAKLLAIKTLKVPKSKQGLLAIKPAYNESVVTESITKKDIKVGAEFQIGKDTFKVDEIEKDSKFGALIRSSRIESNSGKKYSYLDSMEEFVTFLNDEKAKVKK